MSLFFLCGCALGQLYCAVTWAAAGVTLLLAWLWWWRRALLWASLALFFFGVAWSGFFCQRQQTWTNDPGPTRLQIRTETAPEPVQMEAPWMGGKPSRNRLFARIDDPPYVGTHVQVSAPLQWRPLVGECFEVAGELKAFADKDFEQGLDVRAFEARRGITGLLFIRSVELARPIDCAAATWWERLRRAQRVLADRLLAQGGGGTAAAVLLGDRRGLSLQRLDDYARSGVAHVLSVSGLHVSACAAVVFAFFRVIFGLLRFVRPFPARLCAAVCTAPCVATYVALTGAEVPAIRSAIMVLSALAVRAFGGRNDAILTLSCAAALILLSSPQSSVEPAFLFSFASVASMLLFSERPGLAAALASWPLSIIFFQQLSWIGLVTNWVAVPLSSFGLVLPGLAWIVFPHTLLARWLALCATCLDTLAEYTAFGSIDIAIPGVALSYVSWLLWRLHHRRLALLLATVVCATAIAPAVLRHFSNDVVLHMLPVGQGDGLVLFAPGGRVAVIDAGGDFEGRTDPGRRVLRPFLLAHGVHHIDCLIESHHHPDHYGGMRTLAQRFFIGKRSSNRSGLDCPEIPFVSHRQPYAEFHENDNSMVLSLRHHGHRLLLTGDIEALAEDDTPSIPVDVLKIAHHGSRTSTQESWLAKTRPRIALISAGRDNQFGHPHAEVLDRLRAAQIKTLRTDLDGHIEVTLGRTLSVRTFR